jgi:hypothetical protein
MWLLTEFRFSFVEISYSVLQTQYLRYKYKKNTVYGCDSGTQNILWALGYTYPMVWGKRNPQQLSAI